MAGLVSPLIFKYHLSTYFLILKKGAQELRVERGLAETVGKGHVFCSNVESESCLLSKTPVPLRHSDADS